MNTPSLLDAFDRARSVVIVRVVDFETVDEATAREEFLFNGVRSAKLVVESVFKGRLKVGVELLQEQGQSADCRRVFHPRDKDKRLLYYIDRVDGSGSRTFVSPTICGRSAHVEHAADDLLYLNNLKKRQGHTRIYGTVDSSNGFTGNVAGIKVHILGEKTSANAVTNENGVYEVYDLPPGEYRVSVDAPAGWTMDAWSIFDPEGSGDAVGPRVIPITLVRKKHAEANILLVPDNSVAGLIRDATGAPLRNVRLRLVPVGPDADPFSGRFRTVTSNAQGAFSIESVPNGVYALAVNWDAVIDGFNPFRTFYYPNVTDISTARTFTITAGAHFDDLQLQPPAMMDTVRLTGQVLYATGDPVENALVTFEIANPVGDIVRQTAARTSVTGAFTLSVLKGFEGRLFGKLFYYPGDLKSCITTDVMARGSNSRGDLTTPSLEISAVEDKSGIDLRLPDCVKAPKASR